MHFPKRVASAAFLAPVRPGTDAANDKKTLPGKVVLPGQGFRLACESADDQLSFLPPSAAHFSSMSVVTDFGRSMA